MKKEVEGLEGSVLKKNVAILYDMEVNNYLVTRCMMELDREIEALGRKKNIPPPKRLASKISYFDLMEPLGLVGCFVGAIAGVVYGISAANGFLGAIFWAFIYGVLFLAAGAILGGALAITIVHVRILRESKSNDAEYEKSKKTHKQAVARDEERVKRELLEKDYLIHQRTILQTRLNEANEKLEIFYNKVNIAKDYRNLIAIGYINEFLSLGISTHFEGADGLYYLVRNEIRWDQLQLTMWDICTKLDNIIDRQSRIYDKLCSMNDKCERILRNTTESVNKIAASQKLLERTALQTEITAYNTERIAQEEAYMAFLLS